MWDSFAEFVDGGAINTWVQSSEWLWPSLEILHFIGLSLLLGSLLLIDLRMAGHIRALSPAAAHKLLPCALLGFALLLVTGVLFFCGDPLRYAANIGFRFKMLLVIFAGINALVYAWQIKPLMPRWDIHVQPPLLAKVVAYSSLAVWTAVLLLGRLIPYIGTG